MFGAVSATRPFVSAQACHSEDALETPPFFSLPLLRPLVGSEVLAARRSRRRRRQGAQALRRVSKPTPNPPKPAPPWSIARMHRSSNIRHRVRRQAGSLRSRPREPPDEWRTCNHDHGPATRRALGADPVVAAPPLNQDMLFQRTLGHSWREIRRLQACAVCPTAISRSSIAGWSSGAEAPDETHHHGDHRRPAFRRHPRTVAPGTGGHPAAQSQASRLDPQRRRGSPARRAHRRSDPDPVAQV